MPLEDLRSSWVEQQSLLMDDDNEVRDAERRRTHPRRRSAV